MMTFLAPPAMCFSASAFLVKMPVDSMTMSTPSSPHGMSAGLRSDEHLDGVAVDGDRVGGVGHLGLEAAQDGVVLQQVGGGRGVTQVVDSHDLDVRTLLQQRAEVVTTDAAKAVDAYADRHEPISSLVRRTRVPASCMGCPRPPTTLPPWRPRSDIE